MKKEAVHAIVSKMIINEELMASLDEPSECMVMHRCKSIIKLVFSSSLMPDN
jgi:hypothetical protein